MRSLQNRLDGRSFVLIILINLLFNFGCSYLQIFRQSPKAKLVSIKPTGVTPIAIQFHSEIEVENPYDFTIEISKVDFQFTSEGKKLIDAKNDLQKLIQPKQKGLFDIDFQIEYADMGLALNDFILKPKLETEFSSQIYLNFPEAGLKTWDLPKNHIIKLNKNETIQLKK